MKPDCDVRRPSRSRIWSAVAAGTVTAGLLLLSSQPATAATSATSSSYTCTSPTARFSGADYCPVAITAVSGGLYSTGTRVVLMGVTVTAVTATQVTVGAWVSPPCTPGKYCGALMVLRTLVVTWSGPSRPAYGDVLNLFGRTTAVSLTPVGFNKTGHCPIEYC